MSLIIRHSSEPLSFSKQKYKVIKVMRKSGNRKILERNLSESEAQRVVKRYPNSENHMVIYTKQ